MTLGEGDVLAGVHVAMEAELGGPEVPDTVLVPGRGEGSKSPGGVLIWVTNLQIRVGGTQRGEREGVSSGSPKKAKGSL